MFRSFTAVLLVAVLLGCPLSCLADSAGDFFHAVACNDCKSEPADDCCRHAACSEERSENDAPCDRRDCPNPDCICAGAVVFVMDDGVALDVECVDWLPVVEAVSHVRATSGWQAVDFFCRCGHSAADAQRRCALLGTFLL